MNFLKFLVFAAVLLIFSLSASALSGPVVSSPTHLDQAQWYNNLQAGVSWEAVEGAFDYAYAYDTNPGTVPDGTKTTLETSVSLPSKIEGIYYFHVKARGSFGSTDTTHFKIQIDSTGPSRPLVTVVSEGNSLTVSWTPSEDLLSGVKGYWVYRNLTTNFTIRDLGVKKIGFFTETGVLDANGMEQGRTYFYKVVPFDNAGNAGYISAQAQGTIKTYCDLNIEISPVLSEDKKTLFIPISAALPIYYSSLFAVLPDSTRIVLFREKSNYVSWDANLDLSSVPRGEILIQLIASEFYGDNCDLNQNFLFDTVYPEANFVFPKNYREEIQGKIQIKISAEDTGDFQSGIKSVGISYDNNSEILQIGPAEKDENGFYSIEWDVSSIQNGYYDLKASVSDNAGNAVEKIKQVFVFNSEGLIADANAMINSALESQKALDSKKGQLAQYGFDSNALSALSEQAIAELEAAEASMQSRKFGDAKVHAATAKNLFAEAESSVGLNVLASESFIFNKQQVKLLLEAAGFPAETVNNAEFLITQSRVSRDLKIIKISDANETVFKVAVFVSFDFPSEFVSDNNISFLQLLEIIPKEFAENASQLSSTMAFDVLQDDPKIVFLLDQNFLESKKSLVYFLKASFSEADARKFIFDSTVNKFIAPPVLLGQGFAVPIAPVFSVPIEIILAVLAILVIACAVFFIRFSFNKPKKPKFYARPKRRF